MKKLQIIAVFVLSLLFVLACVSDEDEDFWEDETDTYSGGNSGGDADTLPEGSTDAGSSDTSDSSYDPSDTDSTDPTPVTDNDPGEPSDDHETPMPDNDPAPVADNDNETPDEDNDTAPVTDNDTEPASDPDLTDDDDEPANGDNDSVNDDDNIPPSGELPECSPTSGTPCIDSSSTLIWSKKSDTMSWSEADSFCNKLSDGGFSWRMPEIGDLRTLIQNCKCTQSSGSCLITNDCTSNSTCYSGCSTSSPACTCDPDSTGTYSKLGDAEPLWSASQLEGNIYYMWIVNFRSATFDYVKEASSNYKVRCIKK